MKIFIVGGTSGIGLAIAIKYLEAGHHVGICGRDLSKISLPTEYPLLKMYELDIYNKVDLDIAVKDFAEDGLDIMLISAGSYTNDSLRAISYEDSSNMLRINIAGTVNAFETARQAMKSNQKGHIVVLASVSGLIIYPKMTTYSMTKHALIQIANAYRKALENFGIYVTVVAPGYVNSQKLIEINQGDTSKKIFMVDLDYAANNIIDAIQKKKKQVIFPPKMKWTIMILNLLPAQLISFIMYKKAKWSEKK